MRIIVLVSVTTPCFFRGLYTLKTEAARYSEMSVTFYWATSPHIPENVIPHL
jgi:hypothetical protein